MDTPIAEIIRRKRDGGKLTETEIRDVISGVTENTIPDYQISALLMAIFFRGLSADELAGWTDAMLHSGTVMTYPPTRYRKVDKHSTGGVGDKISICLAPAVAACGVPVPMISGRGLGHTGGTLDKLEAIPGFNVFMSEKDSQALLADIGMFLIGQTADIAPADKRLYALRDVTGTVESIPLIASSIMSKKLAEGIDALVLDVKAGEGAFMSTLERARELSRTLMGIGRAAGRDVVTLITDMSAPIGLTIGNALETREAIEVMKGRGPGDTVALTVALGAEMLVLGGAAADVAQGESLIRRALADGSALSRFAECIDRQGGDATVCDSPDRLPRAANVAEIRAPHAGFIQQIHPRDVAMASLRTGAGRLRAEDPVDPATGVELHVTVGAEVRFGDILASLHHNGRGESDARAQLSNAFMIDDAPPPSRPLIIERLT